MCLCYNYLSVKLRCSSHRPFCLMRDVNLGARLVTGRNTRKGVAENRQRVEGVYCPLRLGALLFSKEEKTHANEQSSGPGHRRRNSGPPRDGGVHVKLQDDTEPEPVPDWTAEEIKATWRAATAADGQLETYRIIERMVDRLGYGRTGNNPSLPSNENQNAIAHTKVICTCCGRQLVRGVSNRKADDYVTTYDGARVDVGYGKTICGICAAELDGNGIFPEER